MNFSSIRLWCITMAILFSISGLLAQNNNILLKSGSYPIQSNIDQIIAGNKHYDEDELVDNVYYRLLSFSEIPSQTIKDELKTKGIELIQYLPNYTFYAAIQSQTNLSLLSAYNVVMIEKVKPDFKLSKHLFDKDYPDWAIFGNKIGLNAVFYPEISDEEITKVLNKLGATIDLITYADVVTFKIENTPAKLEALYQLPHFYFFEEIDAPEVPEGTLARTNHRSNVLSTNFSSGLHFNGQGVTVMLQDNSSLDDHIDYTGRFTNHFSAAQNGDHGEHCGGIIAAAGNKDPKGRGMAWGANVLVYGSNNNNFSLYVPNLCNNNDLTITSKSYGDGNNAGYTSLARTLDQQIRFFPSLIHVFSAGNSGTSNFGYGAGSGWGNITGGHKQAKNVLAVGNVTASDALATSSSRGPAADGRIKPDICAVGTSVYSTLDPNTYQNMTGTSMACPGVAGTLAQLYHAYKGLNGNVNPNAALMKATILNTADDLGNDGPDFKHGWGRINARRAYNLISANNYLNSTIVHAGNNSHNIIVPAGTKQLRVMVYWSDYEAAASASKALINDINMQVVDPNSVTYNPWVLNETPNATLLNLPAARGVDDLNNMEQVTIDNPPAGNFTINLNGWLIPQGPQEYYVVYEFVQDEVVVTYPIGGEGFPPGVQTLRWDSNDDNIGSTFTLEYTTDNGSNWTTITSGIPGTLRQYNWIVPSIVSGQAKIRITQGAISDESDDVFSLIGTPTGLTVAWSCVDSLNLTWNPVSGATGYEVYKLGATHMDSWGTTTTTNKTLPIPSTSPDWFSVRALGPNNCKGERAIAIYKAYGWFNCPTGIEEDNIEDNITIYPNPVDNKLTISGLELGGNSNVIIYNLIGEAVLEQYGINVVPQMTMDVSALKNGIYIIQIETKDGVISKKLIKE